MTRRIPAWIRCAVCGSIARDGKVVEGIVRSDHRITGQSAHHRGRVCATGPCEDQWRRTWDTARYYPASTARPDERGLS